MKKKECTKIVEVIILEVKKLIGPVAITYANNVEGLKIKNGNVEIKRPSKEIIIELINNYKKLIGPVAITLAKKAVKGAKLKFKIKEE